MQRRIRACAGCNLPDENADVMEKVSRDKNRKMFRLQKSNSKSDTIRGKRKEKIILII